MNEAAWTILSGFLIFLGLAGTVLPFLPGPPISLAGLIVFGVATNFEKVSPLAIVVFSVLTLLTVLFDLFGPALTAKGYKATRYGVVGAVVGAVMGILVLGPIGAFLGPFLGAFLGEIMAPKAEVQSAIRAAWGAFVGFLIGTIFKLVVVVAMVFYFVLSLF